MATEFFNITGMHCISCAQTIEEKLKQNDIQSARVYSPLNLLIVELDNTSAQLQNINSIVRSLGYSIKKIDFDQILSQPKKSIFKTIFRLILILLFVIISHGVKHLVRIPLTSKLTIISSVIIFVVLGLCSIRYLIYMKNEIVSKKLGMGTFMSIALLLTAATFLINFVLRNYNTGASVLSSYSMILFFVELGKAISEFIRLRFFRQLLVGLEVLNIKVLVKENGAYTEKTVKEVQKGNTVVVKAGEIIYFDGAILKGSANIDESIVTGESEPIFKKEGMNVFSGSCNIDGTLEIVVSNNFFTSTLGVIQFYILQKLSEKTDTQVTMDKFLRYFILGELVLIIGVLIYSWHSGLLFAFERAATIALMTCPCAFGIATPIALATAYLTSYRKNILLKNPTILETFKDAKFLILDKTGTLTDAFSSVSNYKLYTDDIRLLQVLYTLTKFSNHPKAKGVNRFLATNYKNIKEIDNLIFTLIAGKGFKGIYNNVDYYVGGFNLVVENFKGVDKLKDEMLDKELYFFTKDEILGVFDFDEEISERTRLAIERIKKIYGEITLLSGDTANKVEKCASVLGITSFYSGKSPIEKLDIIKKFKSKGKTIFVGDGINDALSLEEADFGISIKGAQELAKNSADVILLDNNLGSIEKLYKISKSCVFAIKSNIIWAIIYNIVFIPLGLGLLPSIHITPVTASMLMSGSSILLTLNSFLFLTLATYKDK